MKPTIQTEYYKCRPVKVLSNGWILLLLGALFIWSGVCLWIMFSPQIKNVFSPARAERVKIAMHDEQTFQFLRQKHGQRATEMVIYEADGKAWYYRDGKKIAFK